MEATVSESGMSGARPVEPSRAAAPAEVAPAAAKKSAGRVPLMIIGVLAVGSVAGYFVHARLTAGEQETDDAQVEADVVPIAARTGGQVLAVLVHDNQRVHIGDPLVEIDSAEHRARIAQAEAELAVQRAQAAAADADAQLVGSSASGGLRTARAVVTTAVDTLRSAQAQVTVAEAGVTRARAQASATETALQRARALRGENAIAQAELDNAMTTNDAAQAAVAQAQAQLINALASRQAAQSHIGEAQGRLEQSAPVDVQVAGARARAELAHARVRSAEAALQLATLQFSYTRVAASEEGVVSRLSVHPGQLIQAGQPIAELVPSATYVVANFKETQVGRMRAGQRASVRVDAFPGRVFEGRVESLSGGTGARFSLLPPDNASGNFVKVVQRVPVRIRWASAPRDEALRAGLSADVTVYVDSR